MRVESLMDANVLSNDRRNDNYLNFLILVCLMYNECLYFLFLLLKLRIFLVLWNMGLSIASLFASFICFPSMNDFNLDSLLSALTFIVIKP